MGGDVMWCRAWVETPPHTLRVMDQYNNILAPETPTPSFLTVCFCFSVLMILMENCFVAILIGMIMNL
jgi:hypothetical protein